MQIIAIAIVLPELLFLLLLLFFFNLILLLFLPDHGACREDLQGYYTGT